MLTRVESVRAQRAPSGNPDTEGDLEAVGFFLLRTPALPLTAMTEWSASLMWRTNSSEVTTFDAAVEQDRKHLQRKLAQWLSSEGVKEAIYISSPSLFSRLAQWEQTPESPQGQKVQASLVRYFTRMCTRCAPFGLMAGVTLGFVGERTSVVLESRTSYHRVTQLESSYLHGLSERLREKSSIAADVEYVLNDTAYVRRSQLRYVERLAGGRVPRFGLNAATLEEPLPRLIDVARRGATIQSLMQILRQFNEDIHESEARAYLEDLIRQQVLVPRLGPWVLGPEALIGLLQMLEGTGGTSVRESLLRAKQVMQRLDRPGYQGGVQEYCDLACDLQALSDEVPTFQVDVYKPARKATLCAGVIDAILETAEFLRRVGSVRDHSLDEFCRRFRSQYEDAWVPLLEALDEESAIGFDPTKQASGSTPLLDGIELPAPRTSDRAMTAFEQLLLHKVNEAAASRERVVRLESSDCPPKADCGEQWPEGVGVWASVIAPSEEAIGRGNFKVVFNGARGPTAVITLSRFCHLNMDLELQVKHAVAMEEALNGAGTICAELVHDPGGRASNVVHRPQLRAFEIPYWGDNAKRSSQVIRAEDIWIRVSPNNRITLFSREHGRFICPRLSNAHNYSRSPLSVYRFLATLQHCAEGSFGFRWGRVLENLPFLPRVEHGKCILSHARWRLESALLQQSARATAAQRFMSVQALRARYALPRFVTSSEKAGKLLVDLDNPLSADVLIEHARAESHIVLTEAPEVDEARWVSSVEGPFCHEVVIPLRRKRATAWRADNVTRDRVVRPIRYPPGAQWLYVKLYTGEADRVLREVIRPFIDSLTREAVIGRWFFLRYADPDPHLRLRLHGSPQVLRTSAFPQLAAILENIVGDQTVWRVQLDTYVPEVDRYGGEQAMELTARIFHADSIAVLAIVSQAIEPWLIGERWKIALYGIHRLMSDFGLDADARRSLLTGARNNFWSEHRLGAKQAQQVSARFRDHRRALERLVGADHRAAAGRDFGAEVIEAFDARSRELEAPVEQLQRLAGAGKLTRDIEDIFFSHMHMFANRLLASRARMQEAVLYDFLARLYRGMEGRQCQ